MSWSFWRLQPCSGRISAGGRSVAPPLLVDLYRSVFPEVISNTPGPPPLPQSCNPSVHVWRDLGPSTADCWVQPTCRSIGTGSLSVRRISFVQKSVLTLIIIWHYNIQTKNNNHCFQRALIVGVVIVLSSEEKFWSSGPSERDMSCLIWSSPAVRPSETKMSWVPLGSGSSATPLHATFQYV